MSKRLILPVLKIGLVLYVAPFLMGGAPILTSVTAINIVGGLGPFVDLGLFHYSKALTSPKPDAVDTRGHHSWPALPRAS